MLSADQAKRVLDTRIEIHLRKSGYVTGLLRAVTPSEELIVAGAGGVETRVPLSSVSKIKDARFICESCGNRVNRVFQAGDDQEFCADCTREFAATQPKPSEECETCGALGAFYSPRAKKFGCAQCHARAGTLTGIGAEVRAMVHESRLAECRSDDLHSERHQWKRAKSAYLCKLCYVKTFDKPAGYEG